MVGGVVVICTPAQHWSVRSGFDRNETLWCGWCVQWPRRPGGGVPATPVSENSSKDDRAAGTTNRRDEDGVSEMGGADVGTYYFTGDTAFNELMFVAIHERFPCINLAAIPIGAYRPRDFMRHQHIDPQHAVRVCRILQPRRAFGVHWGAFELADESLDEPCAELQELVRGNGTDEALRFDVVPMGEPIEVPDDECLEAEK